MDRLILQQDFNWHDDLGSGRYHFGDNEYLIMDGSEGRIKCSRLITPPLVVSGDSIELHIRFVLGRSYGIILYNSSDQIVVQCVIDDNGWVSFRAGDRIFETGFFLTYSYGIPSVDNEFRTQKCPLDSDEHLIRFDQFNLENDAFQFTLDDKLITIEEMFENRMSEISKIELQTSKIEAGSLIRLKCYRRKVEDKLLEEETFDWNWCPIDPPPDGFPYDHVSELSVRPMGYHWLETSTYYGWLKVRFPKILIGKLDFQLMTPDIHRESVILLEEDDGTFDQGQRLHAGILKDKFIVTGASKKYSHKFKKFFPKDAHIFFQEPKPEPKQIYCFRVGWNKQGYRVCINNHLMKYQDTEVIPYQYSHRPFKGIDTLTLHPGMHGVRLSLEQKLAGEMPTPNHPEPHLAYWGKFRIYDLST